MKKSTKKNEEAISYTWGNDKNTNAHNQMNEDERRSPHTSRAKGNFVCHKNEISIFRFVIAVAV